MTRAAALFLAIFTGFTGLVYQVTWQKYLATLLGSHSEATAAVLGIFLGGLSLGYSVFGTVTERLIDRAAARGKSPNLLLVYGGIEAGIGIYALAFPWLFRSALSISYMLPHGNPGIGFASDVILAALLIGPPTVLMGATIPVLTQALSRSIEDATRFHAFVYGLNTVGAFVGALAAGFYVVPLFGLDGTVVRMGVINLLAGAGYAALGLGLGNHVVEASADPEPAPDGAEISGGAFYLLVALLIGFSMMTLETTLIRLAGLTFGSSQFTFSMVVAAFVLCIAIGGLSVSGLSQISKSVLVVVMWALVMVLWWLYFLLPQAPYWVFLLRSTFENTNLAFYIYHFVGFALLVAVLGIPVFLSGMTLPLLFHHLRREYGELGALAGRLYSWNTVGSLLGALIGGYALFFWFDLHHIYRFALAALIISAAITTIRVYRLRAVLAVGILPILFFLSVQPPWYRTLLSQGLFRESMMPPGAADGYQLFVDRYISPEDVKIRFHEDGPNTTVTIQEINFDNDKENSLTVRVNGKSDGNTMSDYVTMTLLGILPAIMADEHKRAFVIGWGTGMTAGTLGALDGVEEVVVAEISPAIIRSAPLFDRYNYDASRNPKIHLNQGDAYRALTRSEKKFDIIVSEPSNPWVVGVEMLYSREFLELARSRLAPGGVYAQWFHRYETDDETLDLILRTYASVFDHVSVWGAQPKDLIILGLSESGPALDFYRLLERAGKPPYKGPLASMGIDLPSKLMIRELVPFGVIHAAGLEGPLHTLYRPILADMAGKAFYRRGDAYLPFTGFGEPARIGAKNSMWKRYSDYVGGQFSDEERLAVIDAALDQMRPFAISMVARWMTESSDSPEFKIAYQNALVWLRANIEDLEDPEQTLEDLRILYEVGTLVSGENSTPDAAWRLSRAFASYYYHGAPFSEPALRSAWTHCQNQIRTEEACRSRVEIEAKNSIDLMFGGEAEFEKSVRNCMREARGGVALCQYGEQQADRLLRGDLSGLEGPVGNPRSPF
ncbi:MAG: fused MFS/spermidine synthase [Myxococcales bacterium]|nr:fused MFS/spermidine synthase [Myxococcales bacterium]